jgi:hypothetical protein
MTIKLQELMGLKVANLKPLKESAFVEPSDQIIKAVMQELKSKTGIIATVTPSKIESTYIIYTADMSKEVRTSYLKSIFANMNLTIECHSIENAIGGYSFQIDANWTLLSRGTNGATLGSILYRNGKISSTFR